MKGPLNTRTDAKFAVRIPRATFSLNISIFLFALFGGLFCPYGTTGRLTGVSETFEFDLGIMAEIYKQT
jgi:hypothetical protein